MIFGPRRHQLHQLNDLSGILETDGMPVNSLLTRESDNIAEVFGFENILDQDYTQWLGIDRIRDRVIAGAVPLLRPLRLGTPWWQNLLGGNALRILLKNGWINYRLRAWKKTAK